MQRALFFALMMMGTQILPVAAGAGTVFAAVKEPAAASSTKVMETEGSISALDLKASPPTMQVKSGGQARTLRVPNGILIQRNGHPAALDQFKVGQRVKVKYEMQAGREVAKSIELAEAAAPRPAGTDLRS